MSGTYLVHFFDVNFSGVDHGGDELEEGDGAVAVLVDAVEEQVDVPMRHVRLHLQHRRSELVFLCQAGRA